MKGNGGTDALRKRLEEIEKEIDECLMNREIDKAKEAKAEREEILKKIKKIIEYENISRIYYGSWIW